MKLFVDGSVAAEHLLPISGPIAEISGLGMGVHRLGAGRNYDGLLDEIAPWSRTLNPAEITSLQDSGSPEALPTEVTTAVTDGDGYPTKPLMLDEALLAAAAKKPAFICRASGGPTRPAAGGQSAGLIAGGLGTRRGPSRPLQQD